jgi:hypothetical protein
LAGQQDRRFLAIPIAKRFIKIIQRCRCNAVTAASKINFVQIKRQNLVFAKSTFHPKRQDCFFDFAINRNFIGKQEILCNLLGNGRGTNWSPSFAIIDNIGHNCPRQSAQINAKMICKTLCLQPKQKRGSIARDCLNWHKKPLFTGIFSQQRPVASMNAGDNGGS